MNDLDDNLGQGVLYVSGTRGYSAYEVAVQNGFVGTEEEWLDSLVGPQGEPGTPFDELTEEQKEEIRGDEGKSAYEIAVENGFIGTEQDWVNSFLTPDGYYNKDEIKFLFENNILGTLNFRKYDSLIIDTTELYEGVSHSYLQGFCEVNGNIVMGLYDATHTDNFVKLIEYNPNTKEIIRSVYLLLYHCNSITYNEKDNKLYVASNSKVNNGSIAQENSISVVSYETFTLINRLNISNLPSGKRIRSVYYDNDNNILYAGNSYELFIIDEENQLITNTITLDSSSLDLTDTNQTLKKWNDMYVGIYFTYIAFWDLEGKLIRVINIERYNAGEKLGEVEDFSIDDEGNLMIGATKKIVDERDERIIHFYKTNLFSNTSNLFRPTLAGGDDQSVTVYVDNTSTTDIENGTSDYPYKDLQTAINVAKNTKEYVTIRIFGNNYDYCCICGCNKLSMRIYDNVTINGLSIYFSNVSVTPQSGKTITLNGLSCIKSLLQMRGENESNRFTFNYFDNEKLSNANGHALHSVFSKINFYCCSFIGNNSVSCTNVVQHSDVTFEQCSFAGYTDTYAIDISSLSKVNLNRNVFSIGVSDSQHRIRVADSSILYTQHNLDNVNNYVISYFGKIYGYSILANNVSDTYYGDVCTVNTNYDMMRIKVKVGGLNYSYKYFDIPTKETGQFVIETNWVNADTHNLNIMILRIVEGILTIQEHYKALITANSYNREVITETPSSTTTYSCVKAVEFYNN